MVEVHRCEGCEDRRETVLRDRDKTNGWTVSVTSYSNNFIAQVTMEGVRFCPFCGEALNG